MKRSRVYVIDRGDRGFVARWNESGKWRQKKLDARTRRTAERLARDLEVEHEKTEEKKEPQSWAAFCVRYEDEHVHATSNGNQQKWNRVRSLFTEFLRAKGREGILLPDITISLLSEFRTELKSQIAISSVKSYFATLRAGLSYAAELELMAPLPSLRRRGRSGEMPTTMRGRPVTTAEFTKMLNATEKVVGKERAPEFQRVLQMIWYGGLRVEEPLWFHRTRLDCHRIVDLDAAVPAVLFSTIQKNKKFQRIPMLPEWAEFCRSIPGKSEWVFNPINERGWRITTGNELGRVVSKIGRAARVVTRPAIDTGSAKDAQPRFATAQNLRQGFGHRHARSMLPTELQMRMRHESIETTMKFYAGLDMSVVEQQALGQTVNSL